MGGGGMLRSVAKLVSAATPGRIVTPRCPPGVSDGVVRANSLVGSSPSCQSAVSVSCQPQASHPAASERLLVEQEGWVFAGDEECHEYMVRDRLVFATPPNRQEVEDATLELENALRLGIFVAPEIDAVRTNAVSYSAEDKSISGENMTIELATAAETSTSQSKTISPDKNARQIVHLKEGTTHAGYLAEAFRLLLSKPSVQGVIMALAEDKAVWDAISKNDAVKVFRSQLQESQGIYGASACCVPAERPIQLISRFTNDGKIGLKIFAGEESESVHESSFDSSAFLAKLFGEAKSAVSQFTEVLVDFIKSMFSYANKEFLKVEDHAAVDRTIKSCFALAVVVVAIVMVKRAAFA